MLGFTTSLATLPRTERPGSHIDRMCCSRSRPALATRMQISGSSGSGYSGSGYSGSGYSSAPYSGSSGGSSRTPKRQTLKYIIRPDGRVEELVTGVTGKECLKVTEAVHEALGGKVLDTQKTEEYYMEEQIKEINRDMIGNGENLKSW